MNKNEIVIFETEDKLITLPVAVENETVWLNRNQMAELFDRDVKTIGKHINNALKEELEGQVGRSQNLRPPLHMVLSKEKRKHI